MRHRRFTILLSLVLVCTLFLAVAGCGGTTTTTTTTTAGPTSGQTTTTAPTTTAAKEVVLKYPTFQVGVNSSAPVLAEIVKRFNAKYAGKIKIEIEEIPGDQAYVDKMKILLSANELPDIVYAGGYNLLDMALEKNAVTDLTPYLNADPTWKASFDQITLDFNSRGGKVYSLPDEKGIMGYFYNKELFAKAGVQPAKTWDEFVKVCDKLKAAGITPLSMDTADSAWLTNLWLSSILATSSEAGKTFMNQMNPKDYNKPEVLDGLKLIQTMFTKYSTKDAVGGKYENGANNFLSGTTAMIANGPWMISDFNDETKAPKGFADKVGVAIYPNDGVFNSPMLGYFVASKDKEHQDAAVEAIKFFTSNEIESMALAMIGRVPASTTVSLSGDVTKSQPILASLLEQAKTAKVEYNYYQALWYPNVLDAITSYYPDFARGKMTPAELAKVLTETAGKN